MRTTPDRGPDQPVEVEVAADGSVCADELTGDREPGACDDVLGAELIPWCVQQQRSVAGGRK